MQRLDRKLIVRQVAAHKLCDAVGGNPKSFLL